MNPSRARDIAEVRRAIFERTNGDCEYCGKIITWESMHMHERIPRSKGGQISLENSVGICYECHLGRRGQHPERQLNFARFTEEPITR